METELCYWLFCFKPIESIQADNIFGFSEFIGAIALLVVIYTITDVRYKFRLAITPSPLYLTTYISIAVIGFQSLLTEIWVNEGWWVPKTIGLTLSIWQGIFGLLFLIIILTWMYYAFVRPPIFGPRNAKKYARELYKHIHRGNDDELKVIANELERSAKPLIKHTKQIYKNLLENKKSNQQPPKKRKTITDDYAHDILLLIANRNFCRLIVGTSPITAQAFFEEMIYTDKFNIPLGQFSRNITSEAVVQKNSFLYSEAEGYYSGLLGYLKPVSQAIYGNYLLVENLANNVASPLDVDFEEQWAWDSKQWNAYCRAVLITLEDYLNRGNSWQHSYALFRAFGDIKSSYQDLHELNDSPNEFGNDIFNRFQTTCDFVKDAIDLIDIKTNPPNQKLRTHELNYHKDIYDHLANLIFDMCFKASNVNSPVDTCWTVHYNIFWSKFFSPFNSENKALKIVLFKVRRLIFDEIVQLEKFPNYKGAKILGICLNVVGMKTHINDKNNGSYALAKAIQSWASKNYLKIRKDKPEVAKSVLIGGISFDKKNKRLVKTYSKGLDKKAPESYLDLL